MNPTMRFIVGLVLLIFIQVLVGTTALFLIRRRNHIEPKWSWPTTLGWYIVLWIVVTGVGLVPVIGRLAAVIVSLIGIKRLSGLDVLSTFILSFCLGILLFAVAVLLSRMLEVELLSM